MKTNGDVEGKYWKIRMKFMEKIWNESNGRQNVE